MRYYYAVERDDERVKVFAFPHPKIRQAFIEGNPKRSVIKRSEARKITPVAVVFEPEGSSGIGVVNLH